MEFNDLPAQVRKHVETVRASCRELYPDFKAYPMQGISTVDIDGDGVSDLMVDQEMLCHMPIAGANCSNRGCDLIIWLRARDGSYVQVFKEHLYRKFVSVDSGTGRLRLMAVSIYAGDLKCNPPPGVDFTTGQSCDALVRYERGRWRWDPLK